jgi:hypothetical protein
MFLSAFFLLVLGDFFSQNRWAQQSASDPASRTSASNIYMYLNPFIFSGALVLQI